MRSSNDEVNSTPATGTEPVVASGTILRIVRPTDRLVEVTEVYLAGLSFELLGPFDEHDGFGGRILGRPGAPYHLEFTS